MATAPAYQAVPQIQNTQQTSCFSNCWNYGSLDTFVAESYLKFLWKFNLWLNVICFILYSIYLGLTLGAFWPLGVILVFIMLVPTLIIERAIFELFLSIYDIRENIRKKIHSEPV